MLASMATFAIEGVDSQEVTVEVDVRRGLPVFTIVGLPDTAVREARERVRAALLNSGLEFPLQRLTANLAPAVGVRAGGGRVPPAWFESCALCGELSLSGSLLPVHGTLAVAAGARAA